jgi:hypothetical protein
MRSPIRPTVRAPGSSGGSAGAAGTDGTSRDSRKVERGNDPAPASPQWLRPNLPQEPHMARIQIPFYSTYGHVWRLAEAIAEGARAVEGAEVQVSRIAETLPDEVLAKMGALEARKQWAHLPVADPRTLDEVDAMIIGTPTR